VAIDVNSGNFRGNEENAEENAFHLNLAATKEIARPLRLRDLGGVIVNDFIDMRKESHRRKVEKSLRDAMQRDRARTKILRTSPFGLIEMTRQRIRPSFKRSVYEDCPCCKGRALVKTAESMSIEVTRILMLACQQQGVCKIQVRVNENVATYLNNRKRRELIQLEESSGVAILILGSDSQFPEFLEIDCRDKDNGIVTVPFVLSQ
jgi:ribonuclease E